MIDKTQQKQRRALRSALRPITSFTQLSINGRIVSEAMIHTIPEAIQKPLVYALPETIAVGQDVFTTAWWMDPYNQAPVSIIRRKTK